MPAWLRQAGTGTPSHGAESREIYWNTGTAGSRAAGMGDLVLLEAEQKRDPHGKAPSERQ